jgi:phosphinothricin acetyltransferase
MEDEPDDLVDVPPEEFVAARDALARRLKAAGRAAEAAEVRRQRRPSVPVWVAGLVRRRRPEVVDALGAASREVARAQASAFAGGDRTAMREATARRRGALAAAGRAVDEVLAEDGRPARHRDEVLRAIEAEVVAEVAPGVFGLPDDLEVPGPGPGSVPDRPAARPPAEGASGARTGRAEARQPAGPVADPRVVGPRLRPATHDDLAAVSAIYNSTVATTTAAWTEVPETLEERRAWFAARQAAGDAVLVAEDGGEVVGFAGYGEFRDGRRWPGYRSTVEHTIHVAEGHRGRGLGGQLLEALVVEATARGLHVMVAAVDGANEGSCRFHLAHGFVEVARMPEVGRKFDRWLDLVLLQRRLG